MNKNKWLSESHSHGVKWGGLLKWNDDCNLGDREKHSAFRQVICVKRVCQQRITVSDDKPDAEHSFQG